jgi:pSer/pThr/pTyr-binding forkhead associated (FHA) protein
MAEESPELIAAQRRGDPYVVWSDSHQRQQVLSLRDGWDRVTVGRGAAADVSLPWDSEVSRIHAELLRLGDDWAVVDDGISRNGTFVNGERIERRRRLHDGDELRVGDTALGFHAPFQAGDETVVGSKDPAPSG